MVQRHIQFEWDPRKGSANIAYHGVSFDLAAEVLADPDADRFHVEVFDAAHSSWEEDRWVTVGSVPTDRSKVLVVVWTPRGATTRIIHTRKANRAQRAAYERNQSRT